MGPGSLVTPILLVLVASSLASEPIAGASAARWEPREGFVTNKPTRYSVGREGDDLLFSAEGANTELPWALRLADDEIGSDARYVLIEYRTEGLGTPPGNYLLHGWEGTPGGRTLMLGDEAEHDGAWHVLATDLVRVAPAGDISEIALKVTVGEGGSARLWARRIWFADELPEGTRLSRVGAPPLVTLMHAWEDGPEPPAQPAWTTSPASDFSARREGTVATFTVRGAGKQMRWPMGLPQPVDLARLPCFSVRYRATGAVGRGGYSVWLGDDATGSAGHAAIALAPSDLRVDGRWHTYTSRLPDGFTATQLAVGLDCDAGEAALSLGPLMFSSDAPRWPTQLLLPHDVRGTPWPAGDGGWWPCSALPSPERPSPYLASRLALSDWFASPHITVGGVPFEVPASPDAAPQTGMNALGSVELALAEEATEVYLLVGAAVPPSEPFGIDYQHPRPIELIAEPEKLVCEIRYAEGPPDFVLPVVADEGVWGMRPGLAVSVVHPSSGRRPTSLLLHDRMRSSTFALLGATVRTDAPHVAEPPWSGLCYPPPPTGALERLSAPSPARPGEQQVVSGKLRARFASDHGLALEALAAGDEDEPLGVAPGPAFEVEVGGSLLPNEEWQQVGAAEEAGGRRFVLEHGGTGLRATVTCAPGEGHALWLGLTLANRSGTPLTATIRFPVLRGITLGDAAGTWYLSGRRGGIINRLPFACRDPLGENHPLQVDGFFSPAEGLALACLTHDTVGQHHYRTLGKSASGGEWSVEYPDRDIAAGAAFTATEAELALCPGDWRAIFEHYRSWLATWYRPPSEKPWWERTVTFVTKEASYASGAAPEARGAIEPVIEDCRRYLGSCDYVHLFGWSASERYGDWGDYDHYDETVGGLGSFRANIERAQEAGVPVGLYIDGYLSSAKGEAVGAHAAEWAMEHPDGTPQYVGVYDAYNECPSSPGWRAHLVETYARVREETGAMGLYVDEYGATDGRWTCYAKDHGHNGREVPYEEEARMLAAIRAAVGDGVALYSEYPPAEVSRQYLDGSFTYQALWSVDQEPLAPHFIDLPRFAFPAFRQFHIIHYVPARDGNWWLLKFPFFNGESYDLGQPNLPLYDAEAMSFQRRAIEVLRAHRDAFASHEVRPLVPTEVAGVFANEFRGSEETAYTLYNANGRTVREVVLRLPHVAGATYRDAWADQPLVPEVRDGWASVTMELGPKAVGCLVVRGREE